MQMSETKQAITYIEFLNDFCIIKVSHSDLNQPTGEDIVK